MFDVKWIRENPDAFDRGRQRRGLPPLSAEVMDLDQRRRAAQTKFQELQAKRNDLSRQIGQLKAKGGDAAPVMTEVATLKETLAALEADDQKLGQELEAVLAGQPSLPAEDVP